MSDPTPTPEPEPTPEPLPADPPPPPPATVEEKISDLLTTLRVDGKAAVDNVWEWAGRALGWKRPEVPAE